MVYVIGCLCVCVFLPVVYICAKLVAYGATRGRLLAEKDFKEAEKPCQKN